MAYTSYTAKSGDSLSKIAAANKTTVSALLAENPKLTTDPKYNGGKTIFSGTIVRIPIAVPPLKSPATTTPDTATTTPYSAADFRRAEEASMGSLPPVQQVTPPSIVDERTQLAAKGMIAPYFESVNGLLYYSGTPYTGLYNGVQFTNGASTIREGTAYQEPTPTQELTPTQTIPTFDEIGQLGTITKESQPPATPALDASNLVGVSTAAPAPVSIDPSFLLAYADALQKANTLRGRSALTRDLSIEKSAAMKEKNVAQADKDLYNAKLKALASLANRGIYGSSGLGVAAKQAAGYEPIQQRSEALRQFSEQTNLASRLFEQEQLEASDIEKQASLAKLRAEELASKLTKVGA